jgi:ubiquinone/menaquinone biosynthesis C-methylase UbiE
MKEFLKKQKKIFEDANESMITDNHFQHNMDVNYWDALLKPVKYFPHIWKDKSALDIGCGCGRNIRNLLELAPFKNVDGVDISKKNVDYSLKYIRKFFPERNCNTWENDGYTLKPAKDETYDFIMSHQVFQHISNYKVRFSLLKESFRLLKKSGLFSFHFMDLEDCCSYHKNSRKPKNVYIGNCQNVIDDLLKIGFKNDEIGYFKTHRKQINLFADSQGYGPKEYYFIARK